jgi:hypothetical protein
MTLSIAQLVEEFVDRDEEMELFRELLETGRKSILVVWGDSGLGKSSLRAKMIHECARQRLAKAEVTWTATRPHDYMAVMRKIRDDVLSSFGDAAAAAGAYAPFAAFTDLINYLTVPHYELTVKVEGVSTINVASQAVIQGGAQVGDIAGIIVKDLMITNARPDMAVPEPERMARLTDRFLADFAQALERKRLVVFFDDVQKMKPDTEKWLWGELLAAARDGKLGNAAFVLCGQRRPKLDRHWRTSVEIAELLPPAHGHVVEYLARRGVEAASREALATMLEATGQRTYAAIATAVDGFKELEKQRRLRGE